MTATQARELTALGLPALMAFGPIRLRLRLAPRDGRLAAQDIELTASSGSVNLRGRGEMRDLATGGGLDLQLTLTAPHRAALLHALAEVGAPAPTPTTGDGPITASARVRSVDDGFELTAIRLASPQVTLTGSAQVDVSRQQPHIEATLRTDFIDVDGITGWPGPGAPPRPGPLFSDAELPLDLLRGWRGRIMLDSRRTRVHGVDLVNHVLALAVAPGEAVLESSAHVAGGEQRLEVVVQPDADPPRFLAELNLRDVALEDAARQRGQAGLIQGGPLTALFSGTTAGRSEKALAASLDGRLHLHLGPGRLSNTVIDDLGGDMLNSLVDLVVPYEDRKGSSELQCAMVVFDIRQGVASTAPAAVLATRKVRMTGRGRIDLGRETIDMTLTTAARKGFTFSPSALAGGATLSGALRDPDVGANVSGVARTTASVLGAIATGGVSLLAQAAIGMAVDDTAACISGNGGDAGSAPAPDGSNTASGARKAAEAAGKTVEGAVREGARGVRKLFDKLLGN
jgi:hypothetical protein